MLEFGIHGERLSPPDDRLSKTDLKVNALGPKIFPPKSQTKVYSCSVHIKVNNQRFFIASLVKLFPSRLDRITET